MKKGRTIKMGLFSRSKSLKYKKLVDLHRAMQKAGFEFANVIFGIDYTHSNQMVSPSLHQITPGANNDYQFIIRHCGDAVRIDTDNAYPAFGFGDRETAEHSVFNFFDPARVPKSTDALLQAYNAITPSVKMYGGTTFTPIINKAIELVRESLQYTILFILCDGTVSPHCLESTKQAIIKASQYPISIVCVGVGNADFTEMKKFDDMGGRKFDNFQFASLNDIRSYHAKVSKKTGQTLEEVMALYCLEELPEQFTKITKKRLLTEPPNDRPTPVQTLTHHQVS